MSLGKGFGPAKELYCRACRSRTVAAYHSPPRAVLILREFSSSAIAARLRSVGNSFWAVRGRLAVQPHLSVVAMLFPKTCTARRTAAAARANGAAGGARPPEALAQLKDWRRFWFSRP